MSTSQQDKLLLIAAARKLAGMLKLSDHGAMMRIRVMSRPSKPDTDGWRIFLGNLGKGQPRLELWLDRFSGYSERKFMACLFSEDRAQLSKITRRVARNLWPVRTITLKDTETGNFFALTKRLDRSELAKPILEKYETETFFGIYDPATRRSEQATSRFLNSAAAFFIEVAESLPKAKGRSIGREDFPRCEDRKWVQAHLARERSGYLAAECKNRDGYRCQVCDFLFADHYGKPLGDAFAEAHHIRPLGKLTDRVKTTVDDLITVCSNCHRMLHRMEGKPGDIKRLQAVVGKNKRRKP